MSQIYKLPLILEPQPEGGYTVTCPLLPELITEGDNVQEALQNANDALTAIVEGLATLGKPLPPALQPFKEDTPLWIETLLAVA
ncbi:MAG: type II toxin-antitoxin system HicB family antitoxin [Anaerolineales bacterium]